MRAVNRQPWFPREGCRYGWPARNMTQTREFHAIPRDQPPMAAKIWQNLSKMNFQRRHSGVQKHHLGVNNNSGNNRPIAGVKTDNFENQKNSKIVGHET